MSQLLYLNRYFGNSTQTTVTSAYIEENSWDESALNAADFYTDSESDSGNSKAFASDASHSELGDDESLSDILNQAKANPDFNDSELPDESEMEDSVDGAFTLKNGIRYYSSKNPENGPGYDFNVTVNGNSAHRVVTTEGTVSVNIPESLIANISQKGDMLVVSVKGETIEIDLAQAAAVRIAGKFINRKITDEDHKITTDEGIYVSPESRKSTQDTLDGLADKIGAVTIVSQIGLGYYSAGDAISENGVTGTVLETLKSSVSGGSMSSGYKPGEYLIAPTKYAIGDRNIKSDQWAQKVVDTGKQFFRMMSEAFQETNPKKQKALWENATDLLEDFKAQDSTGGNANNLAHLIGNTLLGEFGGKGGLLELFDTGLIPKSIASALSHSLGAMVTETNDLNDVESYQHGGSDENMTHGMMARIFDKAIQPSAISE